VTKDSPVPPGERDARYDVLFEPVQIGPLTTRNRFYQVPHCNGAGYRDPSANAQMRRVKAEGGWGVVCTEQVEIHHTSEITPFIELRLWDDADIPMLSRIADAIHEGGALAGIELCYNGVNGPNFYSRETPLAPMDSPILTFTNDPVQARAMTRSDIRDMRRWHRNAALRAKRAGFDLVYVYGAHGFGVVQHFLSPKTNQRTDEYGGSLENRARLLKELIEDTKDAVGDSCAVPVRILIDEMMGPAGITNSEIHDVVGMLGDLPDLWDFAHGSWDYCSATSRFADEAHMEDKVRGLKALTSKPVVGVGRFTSPDAMVRQVRSGVLDLIGAARPSIADPFIPLKIDNGHVDDIRECIGCNICVSGDMTGGLTRCTQNPTFMEEWRKGWHPEIITTKGSSDTVLIVGAGPAGMEAARALGHRGYRVVLAEAGRTLGGRVTRESSLPGLAAWARVRDYRERQIRLMPNVDIYFDSEVDADQVLEFGFQHVGLATGARWRADGVGRWHTHPMLVSTGMVVLTPDDLMDGFRPPGHVVIYDDDHFYIGGVLAELLLSYGNSVTLVTPALRVSDWTVNTLEQEFIQRRLMKAGVSIRVTRSVEAVTPRGVRLACTYSGQEEDVTCDAVVLVTARLPVGHLYDDLIDLSPQWNDAGVSSVRRFGDAEAPAPIAWATYAGHRYARELDEPDRGDALPFRREVASLSTAP
jgi:dimethylamine/trimethylamine dehydrogenase